MSTFEANRFCYRLNVDAAFRDAARDDLDGLLDEADLSDDERRSIGAGDVGWLLGSGVHPLLLVRLAFHGVAGLTESSYATRIRDWYESHETRSLGP